MERSKFLKRQLSASDVKALKSTEEDFHAEDAMDLEHSTTNSTKIS